MSGKYIRRRHGNKYMRNKKMASVRAESQRGRRSMLALEQMLEGKTSLKTQKVTHRNIICIGTDLLNEIEKIMNSDRDAAVRRAIEETEAKLLKERQLVIDQLVENLMNEHNEELQNAKKLAEEEIEAVKYRCEVAEKKRSRMAQQKFQEEKEEALREAAEDAERMRKESVKLAETVLREKMLIENQKYTKRIVEQTRHEMKREADVRVRKAVQITRNTCEKTAADRLAEVESLYNKELNTLKTSLANLSSMFKNEKNEREKYESLFNDLKQDYKRFQDYTERFSSEYLLE